jgi:hypothetical protein
MPRRPRLTLPNVPLHVIQRGNNRQAFFCEDDYRRYLDWLGEYAEAAACSIHAYVLMTNHVHLLLSSARAPSRVSLVELPGKRPGRARVLPHGVYLALGRTESAKGRIGAIPRRARPRAGGLMIRRATNGNFPLGDERFAAQIGRVLGRRAVPGRSGRPSKEAKRRQVICSPEGGKPFLVPGF